MTGYHLAQVNIARVLTPLDSPAPDDILAGLAPVSDLGDGQPGFVWRLQPEQGAAAVHTFRLDAEADLTVIVNLTVWESADALADFVFRHGQGAFLRRRREWFHPTDRATNALWWVPTGHRPGRTGQAPAHARPDRDRVHLPADVPPAGSADLPSRT